MSNEQKIRALRREAREARDIVQVVICDVALGEVDTSDPDALDEDGLPDYSGGGWTADEKRAIHGWLRRSQEEAWSACIEAIAAGAA